MPRAPILALALAALAAAPVAAGCGGGGDERPSGASSRLVDPSQEPPFINALEVDPAGGGFLLTTNRGFFRIPPDGGDPQRIEARVETPEGSSPVGRFLEIAAVSRDVLLGSGHPDHERPLPPYLGLMRSNDGGRTWSVVSRLGEADLHQIRRAHGRLYAFDAVLGAILVSDDEGQTFTERFTPRELVIDFVVDPRDPDHIVASTERELLRSRDGGDSWRPLASARAARLDWPAPDALMRADKDGQFHVSADAGDTWDRAGRVDGEPYKVEATGPDRAFVALSDGAIVETSDAGRTFRDRFRP